MKKKAIFFIGGINGCGKSTLIESLNSCGEFVVGKQKRALIEVGTRKGYSFDEIPKHYDALIGEAADFLCSELAASDFNAMLIDCHYAFKLQASIAMTVEKRVISEDEPYVQALDDRLISRFASAHNVFFVFVAVNPVIAYDRVRQRSKNLGDVHATIDGLRIYQEAELEFFQKIVDRIGASNQQVTRLENSDSLDSVVLELKSFVHSSMVHQS
jgi:energy-coupling factor transporter ATP-binding protein EcfA2